MKEKAEELLPAGRRFTCRGIQDEDRDFRRDDELQEQVKELRAGEEHSRAEQSLP
jgi:predicted metal-dependent hydrolase